MIKALKVFGLSALALLMVTSCIKEVTPQSSTVTEEQVADSPTSFPGMVKACLTPLIANHMVRAWTWDFAYPSLMIARDYMGQDYVDADLFWQIWYTSHVALGAEYLGCQLPWSFYYKVIKNANSVIGIVGDVEAANDDQRHGAGIAYAMRAFAYLDLARMYQYTYVGNEEAPTVPIVVENMSLEAIANNPRVPNKDMYAFILSDLDKAEFCLEDYTRQDKTEPNINVVYGMKARAYLTMEDFENAEKYAKLAQKGFTPMTESQWLDKTTGFNQLSNQAWIWGMQQTADDPIIKSGEGLYSFIGSFCVEQVYGYAGFEGGSFPMMDASLWESIPATDFRKKAWLAPADAGDPKKIYGKYTNFNPAGASFGLDELPAYTSFKFRPNNGGYTEYLTGTAVGIPLMRVEEMMLIEAEAVAMQPNRETEGKALLEAFAKLRNPNWEFDSMNTVRDNIWWQRRVELWGEGFATFDIKRLKKGIRRNYRGTNHTENYRWNTTEVPMWMNFVIIGTEFDYNKGLGENNPTPVGPDGDSPIE